MPAGPPPQNIYDDPSFFAGYSRLERFGAGWTTAMELPSLLALLPEVSRGRVLDLGCGAGQLAQHLAASGAAHVVAVDISERMLALSRNQWSHERLSYVRGSIEQVAFVHQSFDLVVSSLAFHYVADYGRLMRRISDWLRPQGVLVYSVEHPVYLSRADSDGWARDEGGRALHWKLDAYAEEGLRREKWITEGVQKYHRTVASLVNGAVDAGLLIDRVMEPVPSDDQLARRPDWLDERRRPMCFLLRATKAN